MSAGSLPAQRQPAGDSQTAALLEPAKPHFPFNHSSPPGSGLGYGSDKQGGAGSCHPPQPPGSACLLCDWAEPTLG